MTPELAVVIPTRNRWRLLRRALDGVLAQRDVHLEALIVDDGSTDGSVERAEAVTDPRVTVVRGAHRGVSAARNQGVAEAQAPWIALLDDDDIWAPQKCRQQLDALTRRSAEFAYTGQVVVDESLAFKRVLEAPDPDDLQCLLLGSNVIGTPSSVIVRRDVLLAAGGFDEDLSILADWDMWLRLCTDRRAAACPQTLVAYVEHDANLHLVDTASVLREFAMLRRRHAALAARTGVSLGDVDYWRWIAASHRRADRRMRSALAYLRTGIRFRSGRDLARAGAVFGGERLMHRLARASPQPTPTQRHEWAWLEEPSRPGSATTSMRPVL
jgi:glycosyltransferase involved in cell wall biosynthesis